MKKDSHICRDCHFPKTRHASYCPIAITAKKLKANPEYQTLWDSAWKAGFNSEPVVYTDTTPFIVMLAYELGVEAQGNSE